MTSTPKIYVTGHRGMVGSAIRIDPRFLRPNEVKTKLDDPSKVKQKLDWVPEITAQEICAKIVACDFAQAKKHALFKTHGYQVTGSLE